MAALGVTTNAPYFKSQSGSNVHVMYDPPHLMKNLRNNLLTYNFFIGDKVVSFDHVVKLFELDNGNVLRCVPKLTKAHVELNNFKKMNVRLATQVLSRSVTCGIRTYIKLGKMTQEAEDTADFIERVDRLFDIMNSNSLNTMHKWKKPLSMQSLGSFSILESEFSWIASWKFWSKKKQNIKDSLPFQQGLMMTVHSLRLVCLGLLTNHGFRFVLTTRFNQDLIENWFSCIRGKGKNNDSRTTLEYESVSKSITVNWLLQRPEKGSNCQLDFDSFIELIDKAFCSEVSTNSCLETPIRNEVNKKLVSAVEFCDYSDEFKDVFDFTSDWCQTFTLCEVEIGRAHV